MYVFESKHTILAMKSYLIENHIENLYFINEIIRMKELSSLDQQIDLINLYADILSDTHVYIFIRNYNVVVDLLVNLIESINNGSLVSLNESEVLEELILQTVKFSEEIKQSYSVSVYFVSEDKLNLASAIANENVQVYNLKSAIEMPLKLENEFRVVIGEIGEVLHQLEGCQADIFLQYDNLTRIFENIATENYYKDIYSYDYYYLLSSLISIEESSVDTIIVGHSYSQNGIVASNLKRKSVNLSLSSQDLYYSFQLVKRAIELNSNISKIIIGTGVWSFYFDLSSSKNANELKRIENIYYPILNDKHNYIYEDNMASRSRNEVNRIIDFIFNIKLINQLFILNLYHTNKNYFNNVIVQDRFSLIGSNKVETLGLEARHIGGKSRAADHNKLLKYSKTRNENYEIMKDFLNITSKKNIDVIVINFPVTDYYYKYLEKEFINDYNHVLNNLINDYSIKFIDLNKNEFGFQDSDFRDFDHLNGKGAIKATSIINDLI